MTAARQLVFISYSRRDYYFAESLAIHLLQREIDAWMDVKDLKPGTDWERGLQNALEAASSVVLIASPAAMKSPNVRAEWMQAVQLGKPIVIAQFLSAPLPPEVNAAAIIDFRGGFDRALDQLVTLLSASELKIASAARLGPRHRLPRVPFWVAAMALALSLPLVSFCVFSLLKGDVLPDRKVSTGEAIFDVLVVTAMLVSFVWFFCVAFLRRRMGMTRLTLALAALGVVYGLPLFYLFFRGTNALAAYAPDLRRWIIDYWRIDAALFAIPIIGLAILFIARPAALLHWSPTGTAWNWYREHHISKSTIQFADATAKLSTIGSFRLIYDAADAPAADRLRDILTKAGAKEMPPVLPSVIAGLSEAGPTAVLLLTNRTRTFWLNAQVNQARGTVFTVVASAIGLPDSLAWLWKREWIDFRRWDTHQQHGEHKLPNLPEAVTTFHLPKPVLLAHHLMCAFGTLVYAAAAAPISDEASKKFTPQSLILVLGAVLGFAFALPAHRLVKRTISAAHFSRWILWGGICGVLIGLLGISVTVSTHHQYWPRAMPAAVFLAAAPAMLWRLRPQIAFWFPDPAVPEGMRGDCLTPGRSRRTLLLYFLYVPLWALLLMDLSK